MHPPPLVTRYRGVLQTVYSKTETLCDIWQLVDKMLLLFLLVFLLWMILCVCVRRYGTEEAHTHFEPSRLSSIPDQSLICRIVVLHKQMIASQIVPSFGLGL